MNFLKINLAAGYMAGAINSLIGTGPITFPIPLLDSSFADSLLNNDPNNQNNGLRKGAFKQTAISSTTDDASFMVYPNPSNGSFISNSTASGVFEVYSIDGRVIDRYNIVSGTTNIQLPYSLTCGIYMGIFRPSNGSKSSTIRLVIKP